MAVNPTNTPHSPDSGMAISDGVSSSGSPATANNGGLYGTGGGGGHGGGGPVQCLGGPASSGAGSSASMSSSASSTGELHLNPHQQGSHQYNLTHVAAQHHTHMSSPLLNVRPTQARSPYEWMKKPAYSSVPTSSSSSSNNGKFELCKYTESLFTSFQNKSSLLQNYWRNNGRFIFSQIYPPLQIPR